MLESKLFRAGIWVLLLFALVFMGSQVSFIFQPLLVICTTLFFPILLAGVLYFASYPLVDWLQKRRVPRSAAIAALYLLVLGLFVLLFFTLGPVLQREFTDIVEEGPALVKEVQNLLLSIERIQLLPDFLGSETVDFQEMAAQITALINAAFDGVVSGVTGIIDVLTNLFMIVVLTPFILYYFLKEGGSLTATITRLLPEKYRTGAVNTMADMHKAVSAYIQGLFIVCLCVGVLAYLGFIIIGLDYALILAIFIMITNVIPYLGPFIGAIPAIIVGALISPGMMFKVIAVIFVVQQIESLLIAPQVMGRKLALNPLTIILLVMVAGRLGGLLGMIIAVPVYATVKILATHVYRLIAPGAGNDRG